MSSRVVVVTGGGAGIGAAIAEELGRQGAFVVTVDPLVTLDGSAREDTAEPTTADRIVAAGGQARASGTSVTDAEAVRALFDDLVAEFGAVDAVINVAGISRPTSFAAGSEEDWRAVLSVHLDGYRNVLAAALPVMAAAGRGRVLGVTSGGGWRAMDAGAYGCAKRAVASLTWQLGRQAPPGVVINAMSPIAVTRMVTAALARAGRPPATPGAGNPMFGSMPEPEHLGPIAVHLVGEDFDWCSGEVIFTGGVEVAVVERPRLLEVVRADDVVSLPHVVARGTAALIAAETSQASGGGSNPRFGGAFAEEAVDDAAAPVVTSVAVFTDLAQVGEGLRAAFEARKVPCEVVLVDAVADFASAARALTAAGDVDGVVVAVVGAGPSSGSGWERTLAEHDAIVTQIHSDASWARAVADAGRPIRLAFLTDATTAGGVSRAQAAAQHARSARKATEDRVAAFVVSVESERGIKVAAEMAAHLLCDPDTVALSGAELVIDDGWFGVRSHPRPSTSVSYGGPTLPVWIDDVLREAIQ